MKSKRYFWQPELSLAIIYWSITFIILFYGLIVTLENTGPFLKGNLIIGLFFVFAAIGVHRYLTINEKGLTIHYSLVWRKQFLPISHIDVILDRKDGIIIKQKGLGDYQLSMSKKQRQRFLQAAKAQFPQLKIKEENVKISHD
ncbi:EbsA family protein [Enterococcus sp. 669A]|uniref:EbsA family protein n=1 Tax=Candidatus Enterococcus moelleringii TaxID=2815325 RepID=A0ABS3LD80_9ENTE|nr:EbsA family protein [Enterococcus sp. 669A]MBO1306993.1 EbsA family protein [Enterococcus sp. 669A]